MNNFLVFTVGIYLLLCPFYLFESGLPQPADFIAAIGLVVFIFSGDWKSLFKQKVVLILTAFLLIVILVNTSYFLVFKSKGIQNTFYLPIAYYLFNFLFFLLILFLFKKETLQNNTNTIVLFLILSLSLQTLLALIGVDKDTQYVVTGRTVIFFNNPNQLGYYALLLLSLFTALPSKFKANKMSSLSVIAMAVFLAVMSSSRIVLIVMIIPIGILLFTSEVRLKAIHWLIVTLGLIIAIPLLLNTEFIQKKIELIEIRNDRQDGTKISEAQIRGYDRMINHPEKLIYGAGEGNYDRFKSYQKGEIHSGLGNILFSYGILGLLFFLVFVYASIKENLLYNCLLLTPIMLYNFYHQGFRATLFWGVLASIYMLNHKSVKKKKN